MFYKPDLIVTLYNTSGVFLHTLNLKVKHFRQFLDNGKTYNPRGGSTIIFDQDSSAVFTARCRMTENFSRRKGLLTCIQKLLDSSPYRNVPNIKGNIVGFESTMNNIKLVVDTTRTSESYFWL